MKKNISIALVALIFFGMTLAADFPTNAEGSVQFGWFSLVPPVVSIVLAFITKNVVISLFLGVFAGAFVLHSANAGLFSSLLHSFLSIIEYTLTSLSDRYNAGIILQVLVIGGLIGLMTKMGGTKAVANALASKAKGPVSAQVISWILGLLLFFDDYANALIVGPVMRPVTDKKKISREKLAFIVDATAAPVAGIALISTWVGYEVGLIQDGYAAIGQNVNAYSIFIDTIPYRFYNILMLLFVVCTAVFLKEFGPMLKAEKRARKYDAANSEEINPQPSSSELDEMEPAEGIKLSIWNAIVPIGTLIAASLIGFYFNGYNAIMAGDDAGLIQAMQNNPFSFTGIQEAFGASDASVVLFQAALLASVVAMAMGVQQKTFTWGEAIDTWVDGMKSLIITGVILLLAWSLSASITDLGTAQFLVSLLSDSLPGFLLPSIIFIFGSIIAFATGTSYGTMGILMPLAIPLAAGISGDPQFIVISAGAVLTGAIFGDHCSPISDTTILSSMGAGVNHLDHVQTQMPYAIAVGIIAVIFGFLPAGLGISIWIILPVAILVTIAFVYFFGKSVEEPEAQMSE